VSPLSAASIRLLVMLSAHRPVALRPVALACTALTLAASRRSLQLVATTQAVSGGRSLERQSMVLLVAIPFVVVLQHVAVRQCVQAHAALVAFGYFSPVSRPVQWGPTLAGLAIASNTQALAGVRYQNSRLLLDEVELGHRWETKRLPHVQDTQCTLA